MPPATHEEVSESAIVDYPAAKGGWEAAQIADFDPETALVPESASAFLRATQGPAWASLKKCRAGSPHVLHRNFRFFCKILKMAFFKSADELTLVRPGAGRRSAVYMLTKLIEMTEGRPLV